MKYGLLNEKKKNIIVFTTHKAASMFLYALTKYLCLHAKMKFFSVNDETLPPKVTHPAVFLTPNSCFCPVRYYSEVPHIENFNVILHLRDPRDVLTSLFFSHAYSHPIAANGFNPSEAKRSGWIRDGIDSFVIEHSSAYLDRYNEYCNKLLSKDNVLFLKYEQMVTSFDNWLNKFISAFCVEQKERIVSEILKRSNSFFSIKQENKYSHKRQVQPGDHKRKLKAETIEFLTAKFKPVLSRCDYPLH
jgi:hypothetical protein